MKVIVRWSRDREDLQDPLDSQAEAEASPRVEESSESGPAAAVAPAKESPAEAVPAASPDEVPPVTVTMAAMAAIEIPAEPLSPLDAPPLFPPTTAKMSLKLESTAAQPCIIGKFMFEAFGASDPGCVRSNNEDYYLVAPSIGLYLVADGMGGAQAGEHASKLAAETVWEMVYQNNGHVDADLLTRSFAEANQRVKDAAKSNPAMEGMGTTLVAAVEKEGSLIVASVGDSRVYVFENGELTPVTEDQTWVNEVGRRLGIEEEQLKTHPMRHVLTMAIGVSENLRIQTYEVRPVSGAVILMCSDGLHGVAPPEDMIWALNGNGPLEEKCAKLIKKAREHGGPDNITAVLLKAL